MPIYEYACHPCGTFEQWRAFSQANDPAYCPSCGRSARRVYSAPNLVKTPKAISTVRDRSERSAEAPEVVTKPKAHGPEAASTSHLRRNHGRPWQLGH